MPTLTIEQLGISVVALILLTRWLWDYNRTRREEAAEHEPRANPALHTIYVTKAEHAELKAQVERIAAEITRGFERLDQKRSVSVAGIHDDLETMVKELRLETKQDMKGVHDRINDVFTALCRLEAQIKK